MTDLRVCFPFVGDTVGGSHISVLELIEALPHEGVEPVVVLHGNGPLTQILRERNVAFEMAPEVRMVEAGPIARQLTSTASAAPRLARFLRGRGIQIVHTNDARMHLTWGPAARLAGAGFVWHQRSADPSRRLSLYSRLANEVLTISQFCKSELSGAMGRCAKVVTNPFDTKRGPPDRTACRGRLLAEIGAGRDARLVGFVGNLTAQKRPLAFVLMASQLGQSGEDLFFPMFGALRQPMQGEVDSLIRSLGLTGRCLLLGPRTPIEPWIAACDVLVAPAQREGHGRTLIEAMLVGTPVVAIARGGHAEIVTHADTGLLVKSDNELAPAVTWLLKNPEEARAMVRRARDYAVRTYSVERHVQAIVATYKKVSRL
jgi:glycosyltransferase involved in cell wall biosynthesis